MCTQAISELLKLEIPDVQNVGSCLSRGEGTQSRSKDLTAKAGAAIAEETPR